METQEIPTDGRACSASVILQQIGTITLWAITHSPPSALSNYDSDYDEHYDYGVIIPVSFARSVIVILDYSDTYSVYRVRQAKKSSGKNERIIEDQKHDIYCDQLSEIVYDLACWE
jgi:hypothetical protein